MLNENCSTKEKKIKQKKTKQNQTQTKPNQLDRRNKYSNLFPSACSDISIFAFKSKDTVPLRTVSITDHSSSLAHAYSGANSSGHLFSHISRW